MIVLEDADLGRAVEGAERALFSNAGQLCISIERLYVHESIADEFTRAARRARCAAMKLGAGARLRRRHGLADLASPSSRRSRAHVEDAVAKGARCSPAASARPDLGPYFYEPTLLGSVARGHDAVPRRDVRAGRRGLALRRRGRGRRARQRQRLRAELQRSGRATRARGRALATRLRAGTVNVNEGYAAAWASVDAPMGGMKASGLGPPPRRGRASASTPRPRPSPSSGCCRSRRRRSWASACGGAR